MWEYNSDWKFLFTSYNVGNIDIFNFLTTLHSWIKTSRNKNQPRIVRYERRNELITHAASSRSLHIDNPWTTDDFRPLLCQVCVPDRPRTLLKLSTNNIPSFFSSLPFWFMHLLFFKQGFSGNGCFRHVIDDTCTKYFSFHRNFSETSIDIEK